MAGLSNNEPWFEADTGDVSDRTVDWIERNAGRQRHRRTRLLKWRSCYHGRTCTRLTDDLYEDTASTGDPLTPGKSVSNAAVAKIAAKQRPKGIWLTKGADYKHRIQAKYRSLFCEGILYQRQGRYANTWELMEQVARDATVGEGGCVVVEPNKKLKMVAHHRAMSWEFFFDTAASQSGRPTELGRRHAVPKHELAAEYPEFKSAIMSAPLVDDDIVSDGVTSYSETMLSLYHAWHLPQPDGEGGWTGGRYIKTFSGADKPLEDREWRWPNFPVLIYTWMANSTGMWGESLMERVLATQSMLNDTVMRAYANIRLLSGGWIDVEEGSHEDDELESNDAMKILKRAPGRPPASVTMPPAFHPSTLQFIDWLWGKAHEQAQVSELNSSGRIEPGITAAVAMRARNDLQSELFLPQARAYEQCFATLAMLDVQCARDMADEDIELSAAYEKNGVMRMISWETIQDEDEDIFEVTIQAANSVEDSLAGRRQTITELAQSGALSPELASKLLTDGDPDPTSFSKRQQAQERYIEQLIEKMLEAMPDEWDAAEDMEPPDPYMDLDAGILQATDAYWEARADNVPDFNLELIRQWIQLCDKEVERRSQPAAPPADAAAMMPPPGLAAPAAPMPPIAQPGPSQAASVESTMLQ